MSAPVSMTQDTTSSSLPSSNNTVSVEEGYTPSQQQLRSSLPANVDEPAMLSAQTLTQHLLDGRRDNESDRRRCFCTSDSPSTVEAGKTFMPAGRGSTLTSGEAQQPNYHNSPTLGPPTSRVQSSLPSPAATSPTSSRSCRRKLNNAPLPIMSPFITSPGLPAAKTCAPSSASASSVVPVSPLAPKETLRAYIALRLAGRAEVQERILQLWDAGCRAFDDDGSVSRKLRSSRSVPCLLTYRRKLKQFDNVAIRPARMLQYPSTRSRRLRARGGSPKLVDSRGPVCAETRDASYVKEMTVTAPATTQLNSSLLLPPSGASTPNSATSQHLATETGRHISAFYLLQSDFVLRAVIQQITPTDQERHIKCVTVNALAALIKNWRGDLIRLSVAGSTAYDVDSTASDLDVVLMTYQADHRKVLEELSAMISNAQQQMSRSMHSSLSQSTDVSSGVAGLFHCGSSGYDWPLRAVKMQLVQNARVPILLLKCPQGVVCDISVNTNNSISHTKFFRAILKGKPHLRALMRLVKYWVKVRRMPAMRDGGLPSIVWMLLCVFASRHSEICYSCLGLPVTRNQENVFGKNGVSTETESNDGLSDSTYLVERFASKFTRWMWSLQLSLSEANAVSPYTVLLAEFFSRLGSRHALTCTVSVAAGLCIPKNTHDVAQRVLSPPWHGGVWDELLSVEDPANMDGTFFPEALLAPPSAMLSRNLVGPNVCPNGIPTPMFHDLAARISSATWLVYQYELRRADMLMEALVHDFEAFRRQFSAQPSDRVVSFLKLYLQRFSRLFVALFAENAEERYRVPAALTDANPTYTQNISPESPTAAPEVKPVAQISAVAPRATENEESPIGSQNGYNFALVLLEGKLMLLHLVKVCADRDGWWSTEFLTRRDIRSVLHGRPFFAISLTPRDEASSKKTPGLPHEMLLPFETKAQKGNVKRWVLCSFNLYRRILEQETGGKGGVRSLESPFQSVTDPDCEILFNPCNLVCFIRAMPIISHGTEGSEKSLDQIFALPSDEVDQIEMYTMFAKEAPYWYTNAAKTLGAQKLGKAADVGSSDPIQPAVRLCKHCGKTGLVQFQSEFGFPHRPLVLSSLDFEEQGPVGSCVKNASSLSESPATLTPGMQLLKKFIAGAPIPPPLTDKEQKRKDGDLETKIFKLRKLADEEFGHVFSRLSSPFKFNETGPTSSYSDAMQADGVMPSPSLVQPANSPRLGVAKAAVRQEKVVIPPPPLSFNRNTSRSVPQPMRVSSASDHRGVRERQTAWKSQVTESYPDFRPVPHGHDAIQEPDSRPGQQQRQRYIVPPPPPPPPRPVSPKPLGYSDHSNGYRRRRLSSETTDALSRNTCLPQREIASEPLPPSAGLMSPQRGHRPINSNSVHNNFSESQSSNQFSLARPDGLQNSISSSFHDHAHHRALRLNHDQLRAPVVGATTGVGSRPGVETPMHYSPLVTQHNLVPCAEGGRGKRRSEGNTVATTLAGQHVPPFQPVDSKSTDSLGSIPSCSAPTRSEGSRPYLLDSSKPVSSPYALPSPPFLLPYLNTWKMMPQDGILPPGQQHPWRQYVMAPMPPPNVSVAPHFFCNPSQRFPYSQIPSQIASFGGYPLLQYFPPTKHSSVVRCDSFHRTSTSQDDGTGVLAQRGGLPLSPSFSSTTSSKRLSATRNRAASASSLAQSDGLAQDAARDGCSAEKTSTSVACNHSELQIATDTPQVNNAPEFNYYACHPPRPPELKSPFGSVPPVVSPIHDPSVASSPCYITVMFAPQQTNGLVVAQGFPISLPETSELNPSLPYTVTGSPLLVPQPYPFCWGSVPPHPEKPAEDKVASSQLNSFSEPSLVASASEGLSGHETHGQQKSVTAAPITRRSEDFCSENAVSDVKPQEGDELESFLGEEQEVLQTTLQSFATNEIVTETFTPVCPEVRTLSTDAFETASSSGTTALVEPRTSPDVRIVPLSSTVWETSSLTLPNNSKESVNTATEASGDGGTQQSNSVVDTGRRVRASGCSVSSQFPPLHENASIVSSTEGSGSRLTYHEIEPFSNSSNNGRVQEARRVPNKYRSDLPRYKPPSQRSNESLHDSVLKRQRSTSSQCACNEEPPDNSGEDMSSFLDCRTGSKTLSSTDRLFVSASSFASLSTPAEGAASALCSSKNATAVVPHKNSLVSSALVCHTDSSDARCCLAEPESKTSSHLLLRKSSQGLSVLNHSTLVSRRTGQFGGTETKQSSYRGSLDTVLSGTSESSSSQRRLLSQRRSLQVSSLLGRRTSEINCPKIHHCENDEKKGNGDGKHSLADDSQSRVCHCGGASRDKAKSKKREQKLALQDLQSQTELMKKDKFDDDSDVGGAGAASSSNRAPHAAPSSHTNSAANASQKGPSEPKNTPNNTTRQSQNNPIGDLSECCGVLEQRDSTSSGSALSSSSLPTVQRQLLTAVPPSGTQRHRNKHASFVKVAVRQRQPNRAQVVS